MEAGFVRSASASMQLPTTQTEGIGGANLSMGDFFQLMAAELQNQSMYDTVDNAQFMSQMVQFSTLSQMSELTAAFRSSLAVSMLGKTVRAETVDDQGREQTVIGEVQQISYNSGTPYLMVNGGYYSLTEVTDIGTSLAEAAGAETETQ